MISRRRFLQIGCAGVVLLEAPRVLAAPGDLVLVLNAKNTASPDSSLARRMFFGESVFWSGNVPVRLVVRPADTPSGKEFFKAIGMTPTRFKRLWQEKQLSGQGVAPETIAAAQAVVARVAGDPGGLGVALAEEVPANAPGVRIIPLA